MNNQKNSIKTLAEFIGHAIFIRAYKDSEQLVKEIEESQKLQPSSARLGNVFVEMYHFYINLTDRSAFLYLRDKRGEFIDEVVLNVFKNHFTEYQSAGGNVNKETFYRIFNETHKKRQEEYGKYKVTTENEKGFQGNLLWEFGKRLAEIFGTKDDPLVVLDVIGIITPNIGEFNKLCKNIMIKAKPGGFITKVFDFFK